jgi:hypothetical protein
MMVSGNGYAGSIWTIRLGMTANAESRWGQWRFGGTATRRLRRKTSVSSLVFESQGIAGVFPFVTNLFQTFL